MFYNDIKENGSIPIRFIFKYPWLPGGKEIFESIDYDDMDEIDQLEYARRLFNRYFEEFSSQTSNDSKSADLYGRTHISKSLVGRGGQDLKLRIIKIFKYALDRDKTWIKLTDDKFNVVLFYVIKTILTAYNNSVLDNYVSEYYTKIYYDNLMNESEKVLVKLANFMGFQCKEITHRKIIINNMKMTLVSDFSSYIKVSSLFKDTNRNLINQYVDKGQVYLLKNDLAILLRELIRREVIPQRKGNPNELMEILRKIDAFSEIFNAIDEKLKFYMLERKKLKDQYAQSWNDEKPSYDLLPPCIKAILDKAERGENLVHNERLHIAFFYANAGFSVEETVDVFRTVPDFDEKIARYNVEFSRGINGKGKQYSVFSCAKLKSLHMCVGADKSNGIYKDEICYKGVNRRGFSEPQPIKTPLDYVFWKKVEKNRQSKKINKKGDQ